MTKKELNETIKKLEIEIKTLQDQIIESESEVEFLRNDIDY